MKLSTVLLVVSPLAASSQSLKLRHRELFLFSSSDVTGLMQVENPPNISDGEYDAAFDALDSSFPLRQAGEEEILCEAKILHTCTDACLDGVEGYVQVKCIDAITMDGNDYYGVKSVKANRTLVDGDSTGFEYLPASSETKTGFEASFCLPSASTKLQIYADVFVTGDTATSNTDDGPISVDPICEAEDPPEPTPSPTSTPEPTTPEPNVPCEVAFMKCGSAYNPLCFVKAPKINATYGQMDHWGWTQHFKEMPDNVQCELWASATQCDTEGKGKLVGDVEVSVNDAKITLKRGLFSEYIHFYAGEDQVVPDGDKWTVSPDKYPVKPFPPAVEIEGRNTYSFEYEGGFHMHPIAEGYYAILQAVVCGDFSEL